MERKIGEIFNIDNEWHQVVKSNGGYCKGCAFYENGCKAKYADVGSCGSSRKDCTQVIFKKLEKVGEPYNKLGIVVQKYKVDIPIKMPDEPNMYFRLIDNIVEIEIKQNKEDMEEKKVKLDRLVTDYTSNKITYNEFEKAVKELYADKEESKPSLKSFSLEEAKAGKPVYTRDGRKVRIISCSLKNKNFPIAAIVEDEEENIYQFEANGVCEEHDENLDLMMLPKKKEMWINIYKGTTVPASGGYLYDTKEEAEDAANGDKTYVITVKVCWEE